jgi:hypothetical protein
MGNEHHHSQQLNIFFIYFYIVFQIRFTIMVISTLCLASILSNILTFNFAYICMVGYKTFNASNSSHTEEADLRGVQYNPNLDYTSVQVRQNN